MEEKLIAFIKQEITNDPGINITADTKLITSGVIDSFSLVSLHAFIEKEFRKHIPAPEFTPQAFDSVRQLVEIINRY